MDNEFFDLLTGSYQRLVGAPLGDDLDNADYGLLAHDTSADPLFTYANATALRLFEYSAEEFRGLPSRLSAEPDRQEDRDEFLKRVEKNGFGSGYSGVRISKSGRRFRIENVTLWNLVDADGASHGQAARIGSWTDLSS
ncbi:MEKHLA domain-containing protein [Kribbella sp. NPDC051770]|uniref:MEKHLA domain-containing protein n=1 Tax=Kribbella sp. NPDC051770 TaxID=3155413 RepID=UPI0034174194